MSFRFPQRPVGRLLLLIVLTATVFLTAPRHICAQTASQVYNQAVETYSRGDKEGSAQQLLQALQIDRNFRPASVLLARIVQEKTQKDVPGFNKKTLDATRISVEFNNTPLTGALDFIRAKMAEATNDKVLINFAVNLPPDLANKKVTLNLQAVPVSEVLRYLGDLAGVKFDRQQYAMVVTPAGAVAPGGSSVVPSPPPGGITR